MDTIKNIFSPGKAKDDEQMYRTGENKNTTGTGTSSAKALSGEGSHLSGYSGDSKQRISGEGSHLRGYPVGSTHIPGSYPTESSNTFEQQGAGFSTGTGNQHKLARDETSGLQSTRTARTENTGTESAGNTQSGLLGSEPGLHSISGPRSSSIVNKADPRDGSDSSRGFGSSGLTGGTQSSGLSSGVESSNTVGPHSSFANTVEPRVDSDITRGAGSSGLTGTQTRGLWPGIGSSTTAGPHYSILGSKTDSRDESNLDEPTVTGNSGTAGTHLGTAATGSAFTARSFPLDTSTSLSTTGPHSSNIANKADSTVDNSQDMGASALAGSDTGIASIGNTTTARSFPLGSTSRNLGPESGGSHLGRDAAVAGTAGVGASGFHNISGPHSTDTANLLDPNVNTVEATRTEDAFHHNKNHGGGAEQADTDHKLSTTTSADALRINETNLKSSRSQHGRDAALGTGAVLGGAGLAKHEHDKHQVEQGTGVGNNSSTSHHHSQHASTGLSKNSGVTTGDTTSSSGHHGRDAALGVGTGAGVAALATHEHNQHENTSTGGASHQPTPSTQTSTLPDRLIQPTTSTGTHHGRGAAVAGGAYESTKHHSEDHDLKKEAKQDAKERRKHDKEEKKLEKQSGKHDHSEKKGGLLSFLHRDKSKKYSKEQEDEFDRQEQEHDASKPHVDRDVAIGTSAAGTAGIYEAGKHYNVHEGTTDSNTIRTAGLNHDGLGAAPIASVLEPPSAFVGYKSEPKGSDLGDKLHGVERNRGVTGSSGFPGTEGFGDASSAEGLGSRTSAHHGLASNTTSGRHGRDAALSAVGGASSLGEHEYDQHHHLGTTGSKGFDSNAPNTTQEIGIGVSDYGSNATSTRGLRSNTTGATNTLGAQGNSSAPTGTTNTTHAVDLNTANKPISPNTHPTSTSTTTPHDQNQNYATSTSASQPSIGPRSNPLSSTPRNVATDSTFDKNVVGSHSAYTEGRNRLHKDPPAGHPAAQAQSALDSENLDRDSGAARSGDGNTY